MKPVNFTNQYTITAHTGCEGTVDNTVPAIQAAFDSGADVFEIDIYFDNDGVPVLSHDAPVGNEVKLDEAFAMMEKKDGILCNLDIKVTDNLKAIVASAKKHNVLDRVFYTGIHDGFVENARYNTPEIPYYLNVGLIPAEEQNEEYILSIVNKIKECGAIGINSQFRNVTPELIDTLHQNNLLVSVWTVNEEADMLNIMKLKPDNITTQRPVLLSSLTKQKT